MKQNVKNFILKLFIITSVIYIGEIIFFLKFRPELYNMFYVLLVAVFFLMTSISYYFQVKSLAKKPAKFFHTTMAFTGIRILVYLIFLVTYVLLTETDKIALFVIIFFVLYILYTVLELSSLLKLLKKLKSQAKQPDNKTDNSQKNN